MIRIRGGVYDWENCRSRIAPARRYTLTIMITFSDRYRGRYRQVSTDTAIRTAAFVLTSRHVQGTFRNTYSSRHRLVKTNATIRTRVGDTVRAD